MIILFPSSSVVHEYNERGNVCLTACVCQGEHDFSEQHMILLNHTLTKLKTQGFAITELLKTFFKLVHMAACKTFQHFRFASKLEFRH